MKQRCDYCLQRTIPKPHVTPAMVRRLKRRLDTTWQPHKQAAIDAWAKAENERTKP
jgi:hypothetical protein